MKGHQFDSDEKLEKNPVFSLIQRERGVFWFPERRAARWGDMVSQWVFPSRIGPAQGWPEGREQ
ncbi:hypothetical protein ASG92_05600 [Arthrobacter sp. Soil736]|nr:hypothetical protein ASG92_05600 [Arthrobacter sp. Soil736]